MTMSTWRPMAILVGLVSVLAACSTGGATEETTTSTTVPPITTTSKPAPSTTTTSPEQGLDLAETEWVTNGPDGIRLDDGTSVWKTSPFPAGIARDRQGGIAFTDSNGLWWFQPGAEEPTFVAEVAAELVTVVDTSEGTVAMAWNGEPVFYRLTDGKPVDAPAEVPVEVPAETPWLGKWTAANGLSAWVTEPEVEMDAEGQPSEIVEPAHLIIARGDETLVDVAVGDINEEWATIHDFDGQRLILSRGPFEPAMPEETFLVIDLAAGEVTATFNAGGTRATFTGADSEWDGTVVAPDLGA